MNPTNSTTSNQSPVPPQNSQMQPAPRYYPHPVNHGIPFGPILQAPAIPKKPQYNLMIKNIPVNIQDEFLFSEIKGTCNIKSFKVPRKPNLENKGKCFIELWNTSPADVENAKKKLKQVEILGTKLEVVDYVEKEALKKIEEENNFHIDHIPLDVTSEELERFFSQYGDVFSCKLNQGDKFQYGNLSFKKEEGGQSLRDALKDAKENGKLEFRENTELTISVFKKRDTRNTTIKVYVNLDKFLQENEQLQQTLQSGDQTELDKFYEQTKAILRNHKANFDNETKGQPGNLNEKEILVTYDKTKGHLYAFYVFERVFIEDKQKETDQLKADNFAMYLTGLKLFASLTHSNPTQGQDKHTDSICLNLQDFVIKPFTLKALEEQILALNPELKWINLVFSSAANKESKVKILYNKSDKDAVLKLAEELKKQSVVLNFKIKNHKKTSNVFYNGLYSNNFNVNIDLTQITAENLLPILQKLNKDNNNLDLNVKYVKIFLKNNKQTDPTKTKKQSAIGTIEMKWRDAANFVLQNYKEFYRLLKTEFSSANVFAGEQNEFMLCPYTDLEDILAYKKIFANKTNSRANSAPSSRVSGTNSDSGNVSSNFKNPSFPQPYPQFAMMQPGYNRPFPFQGNRPHPNQVQPRGQYSGQYTYPRRQNHHNYNSYPQNQQQNPGRQNQNVPPPPPLPHTNPTHVAPSAHVVYESVAAIENNINEFIKLSQEFQRNYLGKLVHTEVDKQVLIQKDKPLVPRITGMLIDLNVFSIQDIISLLKDPEELKERIQQATDLINNDPTS